MTDTIEPPELAAVRPGEELDWARLEAYLRAQLPELTGGWHEGGHLVKARA